MDASNDVAEMVYGTSSDDSRVMSERVQSLASNMYKEFERMMDSYGETVVKELMPLVVTVLESLDQAYQQNQENDVELELLKDDNEQLITQYEREKQLRRAAEQKYLEIEDMMEEERKETNSKVENLESSVRMLDMKTRNAQDHIARLEDKELETKKEFTRLHERYTDLFKTHMDHMERAKMMMGADRIIELTAGSTRLLGQAGLRPVCNLTRINDSSVRANTSPPKLTLVSPVLMQNQGRSLHSEMMGFENKVMDQLVEVQSELGTERNSRSATVSTASQYVREEGSRDGKTSTIEKDIMTDSIDVRERSTGTSLELHFLDVQDVEQHFSMDVNAPTSVAIRGSVCNDSSIFDELQDMDALAEVDDGANITGRVVNPAEFASSATDNFYGMSKEVEDLIMENTELLAIKNALNVVKDDLIARVDALMSEQSILRDEITIIQTTKDKLKTRISELEEELKKLRGYLEAEKQKNTSNTDDDDDVPMSQRKRFTRVEMARVLMERNQYKERLMELQEAVRWTEMIRASREHPDVMPGGNTKKKSAIWSFFSRWH